MGCVFDLTHSPILDHAPSASELSGSEATEAQSTATAWHYGNPLTEQSWVQSRVGDGKPGLVDFWDRVAIRVSGPERRDWLNNLISQKVNAIEPGQATFGLILDVKGHVEHFFGILATEDALILDTPATHADALEDYLSKMVFWSQVSVERLPWARLTVIGTDLATDSSLFTYDATSSAALPAQLKINVPENIDLQLWRTGTIGELQALDLWVSREGFTRSWDELNNIAHPTGRMAYDAFRVQARQPVLGVDTDDRAIPHEIPAFIGRGISGATQLDDVSAGPTEAAVHLNKGCYRGQETVSRVHNLGKSPRVLVMLQLDGSANRLPEVGAELTAGGRAIGRVGSSVHDCDYGPIALALVKRNVVEKLASKNSDVPPLLADGIDASIDPSDLANADQDDAIRPGRAAINRLRGKN
ncbi:CAF17-like 4Fe-4S cluster assembly/insertion protein YgfZ [Corynebacterium jeikeium]|uniref:CAF17-like 4Fe-4S cluster assembly/insertion protein YgfZ n=1 Tax=Corynebacterium jeikeium TaxID=38289 RepID=UPI0008878154|nr:folate-binding protein YgfZ [Corynebacterium jeikeium]SCX04287.1 glycine cleavage system aminomethyltransferase T [Corynebacterium jeikeium]